MSASPHGRPQRCAGVAAGAIARGERDDRVRSRGGPPDRGGRAPNIQELALRCRSLAYDWERALLFDGEAPREGAAAPLDMDPRQVTALVRELAKLGCGRGLLDLWDWMNRYEDTMASLGRAGGARAAPHRNKYTYTALLSSLAPLKDTVRMEEIRRVFDEMRAECSDEPDVVVYTSLVSACEKRGLLDDAKGVMAEMRARGVAPNVVTYNSFISCTRRQARLEEARRAFDEMLAAGVEPDTITYSSMIAVYGSLGDHISALKIFEAMKAKSIRANHITYNSLISACEKAGSWDAAFAVFVHMRASNIQTSATTFNALVAAAEKGGLRGRVPPREVTGRAVETVLTAFVKLEGIGLAMEAFRSFRRERKYPSMSWHSYHFLLRECEGFVRLHAGGRARRQEAVGAAAHAAEVYGGMIDAGFTPSYRDIACMVSVLLRTGDARGLARLLRGIEAYSDGNNQTVSPDAFLCERVLEAAADCAGPPGTEGADEQMRAVYAGLLHARRGLEHSRKMERLRRLYSLGLPDADGGGDGGGDCHHEDDRGDDRGGEGHT